VEYLKTPLDRAALEGILRWLGPPASELVRKDKRFAALGLQPDDYATIESVIALLLEHPELMQRPVVVAGERAIIARPAERVLEMLD